MKWNFQILLSIHLVPVLGGRESPTYGAGAGRKEGKLYLDLSGGSGRCFLKLRTEGDHRADAIVCSTSSSGAAAPIGNLAGAGTFVVAAIAAAFL